MACTSANKSKLDLSPEDLDLFANKLTKSFQNLVQNHGKLQAENAFEQYLDKYLAQLKQLCKNRKDSIESLFEKHEIIKTLIEIGVKLFDSHLVNANTYQKQLLASCFADFCFYEKLRFQFSIDENIELLYELLSLETDVAIWSRICRFSANLFQDSISIRYVLKNDNFFLSLVKCLEKTDPSKSDLHLCCIRFTRYGCDRPEFRGQILDKRILVHLCKYANKNTTTMNQHSVKQHLYVLDSYKHKNHEFSNQIIESDTIDYLFNLYANSDDKSIRIQSFNLLFRLCRDYDSCRADFGRVNGIKRVLELIDTSRKNHELLSDTLQYIDLLCNMCREAVNRYRFKEQSLLIELRNLLNMSLNLSLKQKLISTICSFSHDQESLNFFLQNSIVDYFIDYLSEQIELNSTNNANVATTVGTSSSDATQYHHVNKTSIFSNEYYDCAYEHIGKCQHDKVDCKIHKKYKLNNLFDDSMAVIWNDVIIKQDDGGTHRSKRRLDQLQPYACPTQPFSSSGDHMHRCSSANQIQKRAKCSLSPPTSFFSNSTSSIYQFQTVDQELSPAYSFSPLSQNESLSGLSPTLPAYSPKSSSYLMSPTNTNRTTSPLSFDMNDDQTPTKKSIEYSPAISLADSTSTTTTIPNTDLFADLLNESCKPNENKNIEVVHHTEACIFYVFSLLSYGQHPSTYILTDKFFNFLLNYLKCPLTYTKNPRALRILNRLTKNPQCFQYFLTSQFSYRIKFEFRQLFTINDLNIKRPSLNKELNQMNTYLNSNKVFFADSSNFHPNLNTIELQLNNNLKLHCLTSSDICYQSLLNCIKYGTIKERQSCALQLPFVLRNCKALETIMLQLNCIDLILDFIFPEEESFETDFYKALLCTKKIINFINYKHNKKALHENLIKFKFKLDFEANMNENEVDRIEFVIEDDGKQVYVANRVILAKKSEYFNVLLNGQFHESITNSKQIKLNDVADFNVIKCLFNIIQCSNLNDDDDLDFQTCLGLIELCDRFMLFDIKLTICSFVTVNYLNKCTFIDCWTTACKYDCKYLFNVCLDYFLTLNDPTPIESSEADGLYGLDKSEQMFVEFCCLFKKILRISTEHSRLNYLKETLKSALGDIIKYNSWKF